MTYNIEYVEKNIKQHMYTFSIDEFIIHTNTSSEKEIYYLLSNIENVLKRKEKINAIEEIRESNYLIFSLLDYFATKHESLVKEYIEFHIKKVIEDNVTIGKSKMTHIKFFAYLLELQDAYDMSLSIKLGDILTFNNRKLRQILLEYFPSYKGSNNQVNVTQTYFIHEGKLEYYKEIPWHANKHRWILNSHNIKMFSTGLGKGECVKYIENYLISLSEMLDKKKCGLINTQSEFSSEQIQLLNYYAIYHSDAVESYLRYFANLVTENLQIISRSALFRLIYEDTEIYNLEKHNTILNNASHHAKELFALIDKVILDEKKKQYDVFVTNKHITIKSDVWRVYYIYKFSLRYLDLDFTSLKNCMLKREIKVYYKKIIDDISNTRYGKLLSKSIGTTINSANPLINICDYLIRECGVDCLADVNIEVFQVMLNSLELSGLNGKLKPRKKGESFLKPHYIRSLFNEYKKFFNYICNNFDSKYLNTIKPPQNYLDLISFSHVVAEYHKKKTEIIPESVISQIVHELHNLKPLIIMRLFMISLNTSRRFAEVALLTEDCLEYGGIDEDGEEIYFLNFKQHKIEKKDDILSGNELDHTNVRVNSVVVREILNQISDTKELRNKANVREIFIREYDRNKSGIGLVSQRDYVDVINRFLNKNKIKDDNGEIWIFNSKQSRKKIAYDMIKNGAKREEVSYELGHKSGETTNKYYIELDQIAIADMQTEFFKVNFDNSFLEHEKEQFDKEEIDALFMSFCKDSRKIYYNRTELGYCTRIGGSECPINEELTSFPCATCSKLNTGKPCEESWNKLVEDEKENLKSFENFCNENSIPKEQYVLSKIYTSTKNKISKAENVLKAIKGEL